MLALMQHYLGQNFVLFLARSAEEALQIVERESLHAVVSDHILGHGSLLGTDLLKKVAELQPHAARILVTASRSMEDAQKAINEARVNHFLTKPFTEQELKETVGLAVHNAALAAIREKMVQELKEQLGLAATAKKEQSPAPATPRRQRSRTPRPRPAVNSESTDIERLAFHDGLTGLYNHRYFQEALSAGLQSARRHERTLALLLVDVDGFRRFNLARSYAEGDKLLRRVAELLMEDPLPGRDESMNTAARYGGDVFGVILPNAGFKEGTTYAERLRKAVAELDFPEDSGQGKGEVTVSVAVAEFPACGSNEQELIAAAEQALREAKQAGRNRVQSAQAR